jgi:hypothetical protein
MSYQIQINDEVREATADEVARIEAQRAEAEVLEQSKIMQDELKKATIAKLGLTADEVAALLS